MLDAERPSFYDGKMLKLQTGLDLSGYFFISVKATKVYNISTIFLRNLTDRLVITSLSIAQSILFYQLLEFWYLKLILPINWKQKRKRLFVHVSKEILRSSTLLPVSPPAGPRGRSCPRRRRGWPSPCRRRRSVRPSPSSWRRGHRQPAQPPLSRREKLWRQRLLPSLELQPEQVGINYFLPSEVIVTWSGLLASAFIRLVWEVDADSSWNIFNTMKQTVKSPLQSYSDHHRPLLTVQLKIDFSQTVRSHL